MKSLILTVAVRFVTPLLLVFSLFSFWRGHNEPGGGFIGGLIAGAALTLVVLSEGVNPVKRLLRFPPLGILGTGLAIALFAGLIRPVFIGAWFSLSTPLGEIKLGTPILFDFGVYLVVIGVVMTYIFTLAEVSDE